MQAYGEDKYHEHMELLQKIVELGYSHVVEVARDERTVIVGYVLVHYIPNCRIPPVYKNYDVSCKSDSLFIHDYVVHPSYQRTGISRMFWEYLISKFKETCSYKTITAVSLPGAAKFWNKNGFIRVLCPVEGLIESYHKDAHLMVHWRQ